MAKFTAVAYCRWFDRIGGQWQYFNGSDYVSGGKFSDRQLVAPEHTCRASVGERIVTVWLPKGAMIRFKRPRYIGDDGRYSHYFGERSRLIEIFVPAAVQLREVQ